MHSRDLMELPVDARRRRHDGLGLLRVSLRIWRTSPAGKAFRSGVAIVTVVGLPYLAVSLAGRYSSAFGVTVYAVPQVLAAMAPMERDSRPCRCQRVRATLSS
jgi:hypothetical protein